jgi:hypothetical protein
MNVVTDPKQAGERLLTYAREGRLVQHTWHAQRDGREVACLLGAAAGITDANKCPASVMPKWMAWALPGLFDGQTEAHAQTFARRWGEAMIRDEWVRIDWDAVRAKWLKFVVQQAQDAARAAHAADATAAARSASAADSYAAYAYAYAAADAAADAYAAADAAGWHARATARNAQANALMDAIEKSMEVARG